MRPKPEFGTNERTARCSPPSSSLTYASICHFEHAPPCASRRIPRAQPPGLRKSNGDLLTCSREHRLGGGRRHREALVGKGNGLNARRGQGAAVGVSRPLSVAPSILTIGGGVAVSRHIGTLGRCTPWHQPGALPGLRSTQVDGHDCSLILLRGSLSP